MKIEFRRGTSEPGKCVDLYVGGEYVCGVTEYGLTRTDWKNASEAQHACREELKRWLNETPPKPEQLTVTEAWEAWEACYIEERAMAATIEAIEKRTREICSWEQEHGDE